MPEPFLDFGYKAALPPLQSFSVRSAAAGAAVGSSAARSQSDDGIHGTAAAAHDARASVASLGSSAGAPVAPLHAQSRVHAGSA